MRKDIRNPKQEQSVAPQTGPWSNKNYKKKKKEKEKKTDNGSDGENVNYRFHSNMQRCPHCTGTLSLMSLATFIYLSRSR